MDLFFIITMYRYLWCIVTNKRMEKKSLFENISELKENLMLYLETKLSWYGITGFEKAVKALTVLASNGFVLLVMWISLIFVSAAAAIYIGRLLESTELGLLIIGGFYFLLGIIFFTWRKQIFSRIVIRILVNVFFQDDDDHNNSKAQK